ncbi:Os07g0235600 [Oryza sativa Japonica Group]|uniref:Os07g0235600 protein n=1 Tax=Oryza sativa subsp. japonica TaxID=39947 RepID=A0A0N7KN63_ORYSJ|nr:Os07g0235600 [Oryza sativa Japonica Group]
MAATDPPRHNQQRPLANHPPQQQINRTNLQEHHGGRVAQQGRSTQQGGWGAHGGRVDHRDQSSRGAHGGWDAPPNQGGHGALPSYRNNKGGRPGFGQRP